MQLRKYISSLLTLLILVSSMGLALNVHYCHDKVSSVSLAYKEAEPCHPRKEEKKSHCGVEKDNSKKCCKDGVVKLKDTKSDNIIVKSLQVDLGSFCMGESWTPHFRYNDGLPVVQRDSPSFYCESHAPPLFKLYCQYIFYA